MNARTETQSRLVRLSLTALVMLAELAHLTWEHFNGGVVSHHILQRADLPAISNWWGTLLLPALTWFFVGRIQGRIQGRMTFDSSGQAAPSPWSMSVIAGFVGALIFSILLSVAFTNDYETVTEYLFQGMIVLALLLPVYWAECVLGFILGMTFTFGAVLPTVVGSIVAAISAIVHLVVRPAFVRLWAWLKGKSVVPLEVNNKA